MPAKCINPPWMNMDVSIVAQVGIGDAMLCAWPVSRFNAFKFHAAG